MLLYFRNLLGKQLGFPRKHKPDDTDQEKWIADFNTEKSARFEIKSETSHVANLRKNPFRSDNSLVLSMKKTCCIVWTEAPEHRYGDFIISGALRVDAKDGYGAGGLFFRKVDEKTYYSFLISSKNYFRLDVVRNGMPFPLIAWTELPLSAGEVPGQDQSVDFSIIVYGSRMQIIIRGRWAAEINDSSIMEGTLCFTAASYEPGNYSFNTVGEENTEPNCMEAFLESLTVDPRINEVSALYEKWNNSPDIDSKMRIRLAETFTAMEQYNAAIVQVRKAWDSPGHQKSQAELLLAGRISRLMGLMREAETYIGDCFQINIESPEGKEALVEMASILNEIERFKELKNFSIEAVKIKPSDPMLWTLQGHAYWNLKKYKKAAAAYDKAFKLDSKNGILAKNAANVYDVMGNNKEALKRYLASGKAFLQASNYNDLGLLTPKLISLGADDWEARSLAGKWAFAVEDWKMAEEEFAKADELRNAKKPKPKKDGAQVFLEALILIRKGKRQDALPLLEEAVALEKGYALFHFRLAENLFLLEDDPNDPVMLEEMNTALAMLPDAPDRENEGLAGWINNFAAQVALRNGDLDTAANHLEKAMNILGDLPAVCVNRGVLFYLQGSLEKALELLDGNRQDDPEGIMQNCAGNLLVRAGRFEEADERYRRALKIQPDNIEYLCNRASCLMEMALYGEADELLAKAHSLAPTPAVLEMISYVAIKKGEYARAEQACLLSLEMDPRHVPSLLSLAWVKLTLGRFSETREIIKRLDKSELKGDTEKSLKELKTRLDELMYTTIECAACQKTWKILKDQPPAPALRLFAMPPDDLPAGSCAACGKTYCISCAKNNLDAEGRFNCPDCNRPLKLNNEGIKRIIYDWAVSSGLIKTEPGIEGEKKQ